MNKFAAIDPMLSSWAIAKSVRWFTEYQDAEVRTTFLDENQGNRVQVAVDPPKGGETTVRVFQNSRGLSRLHRSESLRTSVEELSATLDDAFDIARQWLSEDRKELSARD